jgi:hypothetical protein
MQRDYVNIIVMLTSLSSLNCIAHLLYVMVKNTTVLGNMTGGSKTSSFSCGSGSTTG